MHPIGLIAGALLALVVFWEAFETIVSPRRATRRFRMTRLFYRASWLPWRAVGRRLRAGKKREAALSAYGPLSLLFLLAAWAALLVVAFALLQWGGGSRLRTPADLQGFPADLFFSGATIFTLGMADIAPVSGFARVLMIFEGGTGLAFLALVIGYLPTLSQAFSRREVNVTLLDARAGSPPSAGELLARHVDLEGEETLAHVLQEWDRWAAELLETHVSFPVLAYYRSQHDNQSWVAALTTILDVCALLLTGRDDEAVASARPAFAMARHAAVDLSHVFRLKPRPVHPDRLPAGELARLRQALGARGFVLREGPEVDERLRRLRAMYEPYMNALGEFLLMPLPPWASPRGARDNWESLA